VRQACERLWIGHHADAVGLTRSNPHGIEAIVDLAANEPPIPVHRDTIYCRIPLIDGGENGSAILQLAIDSVEHLIRAGIPTLVCCSGGMSRSPAIAAAALSRVRKTSLPEMMNDVAPDGCDLSSALMADLEMLLRDTP
jgi:protein-tyrosine phosphatase